MAQCDGCNQDAQGRLKDCHICGGQFCGNCREYIEVAGPVGICGMVVCKSCESKVPGERVY
ncbi:MAG: hypothetical protein V1867_07625 [Candidatus Falkowbacteria bacterium]